MSNDIKNAIVSYRAKDFCCIKSADYQKKKAQKSFKISVPFGINGAPKLMNMITGKQRFICNKFSMLVLWLIRTVSERTGGAKTKCRPLFAILFNNT
jgi:hypothetical protein